MTKRLPDRRNYITTNADFDDEAYAAITKTAADLGVTRSRLLSDLLTAALPDLEREALRSASPNRTKISVCIPKEIVSRLDCVKALLGTTRAGLLRRIWKDFQHGK